MAIDNLKERYRGIFIGKANGDTLGMSVEGWKAEQIKRYVPGGRIINPIDPVIVFDSTGKRLNEDELGKLKCYSEGLPKGSVTDDTILTLALARSLIRCKRFNLDDIAKEQLLEYKIRLRPDGTAIGGFGKTTMDAFKRLDSGISPLESGIVGGPGAAPAMKMAPIGMYMKSKNIYEEGLEYARLVGRITHLDPRSVVSGVVQAHAIYSLLNEIPRDDFIPSVLEVCKKYEEPLTSKFSLYEKGNLTEKIEWVDKNKDASVSEALEKLMNDSLVFRCYPFALFMFQKYWGDPINGMLDLVNTGGDCDTTGAIYGSLVGARDGMIFPESWTGVLQDREEIIKMADGLYDLR